MSITLELPQGMEERLREEVADLDTEAITALGLELFRKEQSVSTSFAKCWA